MIVNGAAVSELVPGILLDLLESAPSAVGDGDQGTGQGEVSGCVPMLCTGDTRRFASRRRSGLRTGTTQG